MTQGFGVIRIKTIFRMGCACLWVCEPLGKSACISFPVSVSASIFHTSVFVRSISHAALLGSPQCA